MRSLFAIAIFLAATILVIFSQARAVTNEPPSCGNCGNSNPYEKFCGKLRSDIAYSYDETAQGPQKSQVELCLELPTGDENCGVTTDPLLMASLSTITSLHADAVCMKFDKSTTPKKIVSVQGR